MEAFVALDHIVRMYYIEPKVKSIFRKVILQQREEGKKTWPNASIVYSVV